MATKLNSQPSGPESDKRRPGNGRQRLNMSAIGNGNTSRMRSRGRSGNGRTLSRSEQAGLGGNYPAASPRNLYQGPRLGVPGSEDGPPPYDDEPTMGPMAQDIRDQEIAAGRGNVSNQTGPARANPGMTSGGLGGGRNPADEPQRNTTRGGFRAAGRRMRGGDEDGPNLGQDIRQGLNDGQGVGRSVLNGLENQAGYYKGKAEDQAKQELKKYLVKRLLQSQMLWLAGGLAAIGGIVFGLILLATVTGPLEFIHIERSLNYFHMSVQESQTGYMAMKLARNIKQVSNGERQKTRMSSLGNIYADKIEGLMVNNGFTPNYEGGSFKGWTIDPERISTSDYPGLESNKPEDLHKYFSDKGWGSTVSGDKLTIKPSGKFLDYFKDLSMLRGVLRASKVKRLVPIHAHYFKARLGWTANPMQKWIQDKDNDIRKSAAEKFKKFAKQQRQYARKGVKLSTFTADGQKDDKGNKPNQDAVNETEDFLGQQNDLATAQEDGDEAKITEAKQGIAAKFGAKSIGAIGILCFLQSLAHDYDILVELNIVQPEERIGLQALSWGSANERGTDEKVSDDANAQMAQLNYDKKTGTNFMDAKSVQYETGRRQTGVDIPEYARPNPDGNAFTRFFASIPGLDAICSTTGQVILFAVSVVVLGPITTVVQTAGSIIAGPLINGLTDYIMQAFLANEVPGDVAGAVRGGIANMGVFLASNQIGLNGGALPLSATASAQLDLAVRGANDDEFKENNVAYRLFNPEDPRTLVSQVVDQQAPDPVDNLSHTAISILNVGHNFGSALTQPLSGLAHADVPYDYGRTRTALTPEEMNSTDPTIENPYQNADLVSDILDANATAVGADNYITRAKTCFGVIITKVDATTTTGETYKQYALMPPDQDSMPNDKTVRDPANKCYDGYGTVTAPWTRVRLWIKSSMVMNAWVCGSLGQFDDPITKQACIDTGQEPNPAAQCGGATAGGTAGAVVGGIAGKYPADITNANGARWKVTLPALTNGGATSTNGGAPEVKEPQYLTFSDATYFHLNQTGNGVNFSVKPGGATTSGSHNPRSELREMYNGNPEGYWNAGQGTHTMTIVGQIDAYTDPTNPDKSSPIVIGQVHSRADDVSVWRVEGHTLIITSGDKGRYIVPGVSIQPGVPYTFKYEIINGTYNYYFNGKLLGFHMNNTEESYFKAGNYLQSGLHPGGNGLSTVTIFSTSITHNGEGATGTQAVPTGGGVAGAACTTANTNGATGPSGPAGIGAQAANCSAAGVRCIQTDSDAEITISNQPGMQSQILECNGHRVGRIEIHADNVTVQNCIITKAVRDAIQTHGSNNTIRNNDLSGVSGTGEDINAITFFGNGTKILSNKMHDVVVGNPGGSHTDCIQTWANDDTPFGNSPSSNVEISGNYCDGPDQSNPGYIHQCLMAEGAGSTDGGGRAKGPSQHWTVTGNYCKTYGNQAMKFDHITDVTITGNTFAGAASKVIERQGGSATDIKFDPAANTITGQYGNTSFAPTRYPVNELKEYAAASARTVRRSGAGVA